MNEVQLATCHCIISHPSKPKFMMIRHENGWLPPVVRFPARGFVGDRAQMIADGVLNKYGLKVTLLRHLVETVEQHYVELEWQSDRVRKKLDAVWVGSREYDENRKSSPGEDDPLADWLAAAELKSIPPLRPPWERPGWFRKASEWIAHELDRNHLQIQGEVRQVRACWPAYASLRATAGGDSYLFRAAYGPPNESALIASLAQEWPRLVAGPLAFDAERNWLLTRDLAEDGAALPSPDDCPAIVRSFAEFQIACAADTAPLEALGMPTGGLDRLSDFLAAFSPLIPVLQSSETGLVDEELDELAPLFQALHEDCRSLAEYPVPEMPVNPEFRRSNVRRDQDGWKILNWPDVTISHPFFSAQEFLRSTGLSGNPVNGVRDAYLEPFAVYDDPGRLGQAFELAGRLQPAWNLLRWSSQLDHIEPESVAAAAKARVMQRICRNLMHEHGQRNHN